MLWGIFASFSPVGLFCQLPQVPKRLKDDAESSSYAALGSPDTSDLSPGRLSVLQQRRAELADHLDADLRRIDAERRERLRKLDLELAETVEALHRDHAERANEVIVARRQELEEIQRRLADEDEEAGGKAAAATEGVTEGDGAGEEDGSEDEEEDGPDGDATSYLSHLVAYLGCSQAEDTSIKVGAKTVMDPLGDDVVTPRGLQPVLAESRFHDTDPRSPGTDPEDSDGVVEVLSPKNAGCF